MRMAADIRVHGDRVHEALFVLAVEELEPVHPHFLDVARVHPAVAVGRWRSHETSAPTHIHPKSFRLKQRRTPNLTFLDKHHRRQIVRVPARGDLAETRHLAGFERFHPVVWVLFVVDGGPLVAGAQPVALAVVVGEGVVVFEAVFKHQLGAFLGGFPPGSDDAARRFAVLEVGDEVVALFGNPGVSD